MEDFSGNRCCCGFLTFLFLLEPGTDKLIFSGFEVSLSMCSHNSCAASGQSKLSPIILRWSDDKNMVWNACPATLYADRLSMVSCHKVKQVPLSARRILIRRLLRDRVSPESRSTTGMPVYRNVQEPSFDVSLRYKLASELHTKTWKTKN